ncbi:MAG: BlaI/MecI/CopY family transcriptional regulator [Pseudomonadales bacterium]|nr:BlaI/MecI/CopY family transcriptional regulator [Pseudomonadales bacterium]
MRKPNDLSRRERQILDVIYEMESASVKDVQNALADGSSESTIRTLLGILVAKGVLKKEASGLKFMYFPVVAKEKASLQALENVVATFFDKKPSLAVRSLLEMKKGKIPAEEIAEIEALLESKKSNK